MALSASMALLTGLPTVTSVAQTGNIFDATLQDQNQTTTEVSTAQLQQILLDGSAIVIDSRPARQYAAGHIPGALSATSGRGVASVDQVAQLVGGDKAQPVVLYCNGIYCEQSPRFGDELVAAGFTHVRRYQLGLPVWRALGGVTEMALDPIMSVYEGDKTAIFIDARAPDQFQAGSLPRALSDVAPPDDLFPGADHNAKIVVFGQDGAEARAHAEAIAQHARDNVSYYPGPVQDLLDALGQRPSDLGVSGPTRQ